MGAQVDAFNHTSFIKLSCSGDVEELLKTLFIGNVFLKLFLVVVEI